MPRSTTLFMSRRAALGAIATTFAFQTLRSVHATTRAAALQYPVASAVDASGVIYVADLLLPGVWKIAGGKAAIFHQADKKFRNPLSNPRAIAAIEKDTLLVTDTAARDVFLVKTEGAPKSLTGGKLDVPAAILQVENEFYVADTERNEIWKGTLEGKWAKWADVPAPRGLSLGNDKQILVVSGKDNILYSLSPNGGKPEKLASGEAAGYWTSVAIGKDGIPVIVDAYAKTLWRIESGKTVAWIKGEPFVHPVHITRAGDNFLVTDSRAKAIIEVTPEGKARVLEVTTS